MEDQTPCTSCTSSNPWKLKCQTTFPWLYDCTGLTSSSNPTLKTCHDCNRSIALDKLLGLLTFVLPFGASYGDWLGGVSDPDLNLTIKAMTGTFLIDLIVRAKEKRDGKKSSLGVAEGAIIGTLGVGGWVLMSQVVQDFIFHGSPNRFIGSVIAGLANYLKMSGVGIKGVSSQQTGGSVIFLTALASFAGNWSMMGDNLLSRFVSVWFASFLSFFSAIPGSDLKCIATNDLWPKELIMDAMKLGAGTGLVGTIVESAIGKPVVSGIAAGFSSLYIANSIFSGSEFAKC